MREDLIRQDRSVTKGSIFDVAAATKSKPEDVLAEADVIVMLDLSSSMATRLNDGTTRYDRAVEALSDIQKNFPGRVVLITFSGNAKMELGGMPGIASGSTNIYAALELAHQFDDMDSKFYLISDGEPTDTSELRIFDLAKTFKDPINCIFIGQDDDYSGMKFMKELARITKGIDSGRIEPAMLGETLKLLVTGK